MSWYRAGTISLTNGSGTVTGSGTAFIANAQIGEGLVAPDGRVYEIVGIASDTSLTISPAYLGSTASGQVYAIAPLRGRIAQLLSETSSLLSSFATVRDGIGAGLFPDGAVSLPGFRFAADQDTGVRRVGGNAMALVTGGVDRLSIGASGTTTILNGDANASGLTVRQASGNQFATSGVLATGPTGVGAQGATGYLHVNQNAGGTQGAATIAQLNENGSFVRTIAQYDYQAQNWTFSTSGGASFVLQSDTTIRPATDNLQNLGLSSFRFSTIFAGTGTINTSDEREKEWRGPLNEAELKAAKRIAAEIGIFRFLDGSRLHCGVKAQQAFGILEDEGLEWRRYGWCCYDKWDATPAVPATEAVKDETGKVVYPAQPAKPAIPAGDRYGIRSDQLALWLIAAQEQRLLALEAAL